MAIERIKIASGHNNAAGYAVLQPQPRFEGLVYPRERVAADGSWARDGALMGELIWPNALEDLDLDTILDNAGLTGITIASALVTVRLPDRTWTSWADYNAVAKNVTHQRDARRGQLRYEGGVTLKLFRVTAI